MNKVLKVGGKILKAYVIAGIAVMGYAYWGRIAKAIRDSDDHNVWSGVFTVLEDIDAAAEMTNDMINEFKDRFKR